MDTGKKEDAIAELVRNPLSRRRFGQQMVTAAAGAAGLSLFSSEQLWAQSGLTDVDILNFALNLE